MADKWQLFVEQFITYEGYRMVLDGLQATIIIAVGGLLIGIVIGTLIAITKVVPQYSVVAKVFNRISDIYVGFSVERLWLFSFCLHITCCCLP